jgi:hypothetical protein
MGRAVATAQEVAERKQRSPWLTSVGSGPRHVASTPTDP